jgi:hypothetical protein
MKPIISSRTKGQLLIGDKQMKQDFFIDYEGVVRERQKTFLDSRDLQILSLSEAHDYYDPNINEMIIGFRADNKLMLSNEATDFFEEKQCKIKMLPLQEAITYWNRYEGRAVGLFHVSK